jgi:hypothetical protein
MSLFKRAQRDPREIFSEYYKIAEEFNIGDQPESWQTNIANVALENNPYLSNYAVDVLLDKTDGDRGSAYGNLTIRNKVEDNNLNDVKSVKVPVIVQDHKLKPFDLMNNDGKISPLSEEKLRDALFSHNVTELSNRRPLGDRYIGGQSAPPFLGYGGTSGYSYSYDGMGKFALDQISITEEQKEDMVDALSNKEMEYAFLNNPSFSAAIEKIANKIPQQEDAICMQFQKLSHREVLIKWATATGIYQEKVSTAEAAEMTGNSEVFSLAPGGDITLTTNTAEKNTLDSRDIKEITSFGQYKVQDVEGNELLGYVIPMISLDNKQLPSYLFTNGSVSCIQPRIAGELVATGTKLPSNSFSGDGVFYLERDGSVVCSEPVEISHSEGNVLHCADMFGQEIVVNLVDMNVPIKLSETEYAIPSYAKFLHLPDEATHLREDPMTFMKVANTLSPTYVTRYHDEYVVEDMEKRAYYARKDAEFLLYTLGFDGKEALQKLAKHGDEVTLYGAVHSSPKEKVAVDLAVPFSETLKIAASLKDEDTIDKVLSMSFINEDNVNKYINMLPDFEDIEYKLADLLFASRLGISDIPEENVSSAMGHVGKILKGLKNIKEKNNMAS